MTKPKATAPPEVCPKCGGSGYTLDEATLTAQVCDCGIVEQSLFRTRFKAARIPARFADKDFENFVENPAESIGGRAEPASVSARREVRNAGIGYARSFSHEETDGLILRGTTGVGKTHLAVAILKAVIRRGYTGYYANFSDFLSRLRSSFQADAGTETENQLMDIVESVDLLVLDDVGAERLTEFVTERLYLIINRRYEAAKPIIMTTNFDEEELRARIGERTASRLCEMCSVSFPPFPRADTRRMLMH